MEPDREGLMLYLSAPYIVERIWNHANVNREEIMKKWAYVTSLSDDGFAEEFDKERWSLYNKLACLLHDANLPCNHEFWDKILHDIYNNKINLQYFEHYDIFSLFTTVEPMSHSDQLMRNVILSKIFDADIGGTAVQMKTSDFDNYFILAAHPIINFNGKLSSISSILKSKVSEEDDKKRSKIFANINLIRTHDDRKVAYIQHFNKFYYRFNELNCKYKLFSCDIVIDWFPYLASLPYMYIKSDFEKNVVVENDINKSVDEIKHKVRGTQNVHRINNSKMDDHDKRSGQVAITIEGIRDSYNYNLEYDPAIRSRKIQIDKNDIRSKGIEETSEDKNVGFLYYNTNSAFYSHKRTVDKRMTAWNDDSILRSSPNSLQTKRFIEDNKLQRYINASKFGYFSSIDK